MQQDIVIKFCVVGEPSVGKTSMLYQPTIGCDFSTKLNSNLDGKPVRLQLWDIAGQQRFNAVSKMYLRGALGCLIVCSSTDASTIQQTLKWKRIIQENSDYGNQTNIPCLLVQNKSDMIIPDQVAEHQTKQYLDNFAKNNGFCASIQCSAKTNTNVEDSFQMLLDETIQRGLFKGNSIKTGDNVQQLAAKKQKRIKLTNQKSVEETKKKKKCC